MLGAARRAMWCIADEAQQRRWPPSPCARRVAAARPRLLRWRSYPMGTASAASRRLAFATVALATRLAEFLSSLLVLPEETAV
jgi:hypothetical protein